MSSPPCILLVEDNDQNAYLARFLLERAGMRVVAARTGAEGMECARSHRPDLILLDIQLPDVDGYELAERVRADPLVRETPLIAVTSFAMPTERERAFAVGCNGYIEKPIAPLSFVDQVRAFLPSP